MSEFTVKDSGARMEFDSGMVRDTEEGKTDYSLVLDGPMFERWAEHLTKGAQKYAPRNWMKATGEAEEQRFKRSALRHFLQWYRGERDEDHAAATIFNMNGAEYVAGQLPSPCGCNEDTPESVIISNFNAEYGPWGENVFEQCEHVGPEHWACERMAGHSGDHAFPFYNYDAPQDEGTWPRG